MRFFLSTEFINYLPVILLTTSGSAVTVLHMASIAAKTTTLL